MNIAGLFALGLLSWPVVVGAAPAVDRNKVWFKPALTVNSAPVCADILRVEQDIFFAAHGRYLTPYADLNLIERPDESYDDPRIETVGAGHERQWIFTRPGGRRVFVQFQRFGGCGSACETERALVADKPFDSTRPVRDETLPGTPRAPSWNLYKGSDGEFYALGIVDAERSQAYRLATGAAANLVCEVALKPTKLSNNEDPAVRHAWQSVESLENVYGSISQGAGNCGSLQAHWLNQRRAQQALQNALYRPWGTYPNNDFVPVTLPELRLRYPSEDPQWSLEQQLQAWALGGLAEYRAWQHYLLGLQRATEDLAGFYRQKFAWREAEAKEQAARALHDALESGFAFTSSHDYDVELPDRPLRRAILERQSLDVIKQLELAERASEQGDKNDNYDSILNIAIEYPEALQYLLSKGLDPNAPNEFGKTPLMYAAQYNQLEATRVLLAAGADPNAATFLPSNDCYYTLQTSGMTPLHYAARYASAPLIRMLVAAGAATYNKTRKEYPAVEETPLDWLRKHTGNAPTIESDDATAEPDKNLNLTDAELPALFDLLSPPGDGDRQRTSATLVTRGQAEYGRGEFKSAYRTLRLALSAQPTNERALADMPLVAFKAGEYQEAIGAARRAIESSTSISVQAAAWFNLGLICERTEIRTEYYRTNRCDDDWIWPFVQAWKLQPTRARAEKLRHAFDQVGTGSCTKAGEPANLKLWVGSKGYAFEERIHVMHAGGAPLDVEPAPDLKRLIDNLPIQDQAITVLERRRNNKPLPSINGLTCQMPTVSK